MLSQSFVLSCLGKCFFDFVCCMTIILNEYMAIELTLIITSLVIRFQSYNAMCVKMQ